MGSQIHLRVVTPVRVVFDDQVKMVVLRGTEGDMGVMAGHENRAAVLGYGTLRIFSEESSEKKLAIFGGFAEIINDEVIVLSDAAEWPEDIDKARAEAAKRRAEQRLLQKSGDVDMQRAELALRRALVRMEVSSYPLIQPTRSPY
jgi:F-type H+-transporting ATPase subunit epsilon